MLQDLRYGVRMLFKSKGFTVVAVLSLALGIGANTALFSVVDAVLLRMLPVPEPQRLVLFEWQAGKTFRSNGMRGSFLSGPPDTKGASVFRYDMYQKLTEARAQSGDSPISDFFTFAPIWEMTAVVNDQAEVIQGQVVSGNYYAGVGVKPLLGRAIADADDDAGAPAVAMISHKYWMERFGGDPSAIGRQLKLNQALFTIVGINPPGFTGTVQVDQHPDVTVPVAFEPLLLGERSGMSRGNKPGIWWLHLMGRLKPGATIEQARDSLNGTFQKMALEVMPPPRKETDPTELEAKDYPRLIGRSGSQGTMESRKTYAGTIYGLFIVVGLVLLIACANVANLLLARAALRGPEIGIRLAVGAGRWRLIRQLLTESVLLSALGGAVGVVFALWGRTALVAMSDPHTRFLPSDVNPDLNLKVLAFTIGVSLITGILFGLAPAFRATRIDLATSLKQSKRTTGTVSRLSKGLVVAQVSLSLLLLIGAGLFIRTMYNLQKVNVGFNQQNLLLFGLQPQQGGYKDERLVDFYRRLFERLDNMPGVRSATFGRVPLIAHYMFNTGVLLPGETMNSATDHSTNRQMIRENYFSTLEIPVLRGREFGPHDTAKSPVVAIVNQTFSSKFFPGDDALGKRVVEADDRPEERKEYEIVGVVADTKYDSQRSEIEPLLYTPWQQETKSIDEMYFSLRTAGEPTALVSSVREVVRQADSNLPITDLKTQTSLSQESLGQERLYTRLLSFFGALALLLAAIGLSGVLAYSVAQRTNEIGIRMALGAQSTNVLRLVIWQGMKLVLVGLVIGGFAVYGLSRLLASEYFDRSTWQHQLAEQLYGVKANDPLTFVLIASLLTVVALIACWLPARKASRVDPLAALRHE